MTKSIFTNRYGQFRDLLIEARKRTGITQTALAKRLSRPQSFVSKFERGERRLDVIEFLEVVEALGISPHNFINKLKQNPRNISQKTIR